MNCTKTRDDEPSTKLSSRPYIRGVLFKHRRRVIYEERIGKTDRVYSVEKMSRRNRNAYEESARVSHIINQND